MSINPSTLAAFNEFKQENRAYHSMKDIYLDRLQRLADENLLTESDFKLNAYVLISLVGGEPASGMGSPDNAENRIQALRDKVITPLLLQEFLDLDLRPHSMAGLDLALSEEGLFLLSQGIDLKKLIIDKADGQSVNVSKILNLALQALITPDVKPLHYLRKTEI